MKSIKKMLALVIAGAMMIAAVPAMADTLVDGDTYNVSPDASNEKYTVTINTPAGHTYEIYQVFTGEVSGTTLTNLKYGTASSGTAGAAVSAEDMAKLKNFSEKDYANDQARIDDLEQFVNWSGTKVEFGSGVTSTELAPGYYVIKDKDGTVPNSEGATLYMFKVLGANLSISAKSDKPSSEKKVQDINDSTDTDYTDLQDSADHEIGDTIPYTLTFTLPSDYANYEHYYVEFKDTLTRGLTYNGDAQIFYKSTDTTGDSINFGSGLNLSYVITDLKTGTDEQKDLVAGDVITIKYTCYLNDNAVIGSAGNPNTYKVEFSSNPNKTGDGTKKPEETKETPEDKNIVFTYKTIFNKIDEDKNPLKGADFTLYKLVDGSYVDVTGLGTSAHPKKDGSTAGTTFSFTGLDDGTYKLVESTVPAGYNQMEDMYFTITADHDILSDNPKLTSLTGIGTSGTPTEFVMTPSEGDGTLTSSIMNQSGSTLPETGGIGTTIFYAMGAILVLGAGILLVSKRRAA